MSFQENEYMVRVFEDVSEYLELAKECYVDALYYLNSLTELISYGLKDNLDKSSASLNLWKTLRNVRGGEYFIRQAISGTLFVTRFLGTGKSTEDDLLHQKKILEYIIPVSEELKTDHLEISQKLETIRLSEIGELENIKALIEEILPKIKACKN